MSQTEPEAFDASHANTLDPWEIDSARWWQTEVRAAFTEGWEARDTEIEELRARVKYFEDESKKDVRDDQW